MKIEEIDIRYLTDKRLGSTTVKMVLVQYLKEYLQQEIDETLKESGNNPFDEGYIECCNKLIKKLS